MRLDFFKRSLDWLYAFFSQLHVACAQTLSVIIWHSVYLFIWGFKYIIHKHLNFIRRLRLTFPSHSRIARIMCMYFEYLDRESSDLLVVILIMFTVAIVQGFPNGSK